MSRKMFAFIIWGLFLSCSGVDEKPCDKPVIRSDMKRGSHPLTAAYRREMFNCISAGVLTASCRSVIYRPPYISAERPEGRTSHNVSYTYIDRWIQALEHLCGDSGCPENSVCVPLKGLGYSCKKRTKDDPYLRGYSFDAEKQMWYRIYYMELNWTSAAKVCANDGASLIRFKNIQELRGWRGFRFNEVNQDNVWIGCSFNGRSGDYVWMDGTVVERSLISTPLISENTCCYYRRWEHLIHSISCNSTQYVYCFIPQ